MQFARFGILNILVYDYESRNRNEILMYRIVVISDSETFLRNAQKFLPKYIGDIRVVPLSDPNGIDNVLEEKSVDAYIVDNDPPIIDAISIFNRRNAKQDYRPFMITAEEFDEDTLLKSFEIGIGCCFPRRSAPAVDFLSMAKKIIPLIERHRVEIDNKNSDRRLRSLVKLARMYNHTMDEIMHFALEESISLTDSEVGYIAIYNENKDELEMRAWSHSAATRELPDMPMKYSLPQTGLWGMPVRLRQSMIVNDYDSSSVQGKKGTPPGHIKLERLIMIPLLYKSDIVGTACVANKNRDYTEADRDQFILMMDGFVSVYVEKKRIGYRNLAERKLKRIMEALPDATVIIDKKLRIQEYNRSADELLGINGADVMNTDMTPLSLKLMYEVTRFTLDNETGRPRTDITEIRDSGRVYTVEIATTDTGEEDVNYLITLREGDAASEHDPDSCDFYGMMDDAVTAVENSYKDRLSEQDIPVSDGLRLDFESMMDLARIYSIHPNMNGENNQWQDVSEMIDRAVSSSGIGCEIEDNVGSIFIKASPDYYRAFVTASHMLLRRGAEKLSINYRIFHGTLTVHIDCGAPYNLVPIVADDSDLSPVDSACLHFIEHISRISGYTFRKEWLTSSNMRLSIDVPAELYEIH